MQSQSTSEPWTGNRGLVCASVSGASQSRQSLLLGTVSDLDPSRGTGRAAVFVVCCQYSFHPAEIISGHERQAWIAFGVETSRSGSEDGLTKQDNGMTCGE